VIAIPSSAASLFDDINAKEFVGADYVTTNGVLHHVADDDLKRCARAGRSSCSSRAIVRDRPPSLDGRRTTTGGIDLRRQGYRATLSDEVRMIICKDYAQPYLRGWARHEDGRLKAVSPAAVFAKSAMIPADLCRRTHERVKHDLEV
jgi:hypothetical protein